MRTIMPAATFVLCGLLVGLVRTGYAHDPGMSRANLRIDRDELVVRLTFARRDIESLVPLDASQDGRATPTEFAAADGALRALASEAVQLQADDTDVVARDVTVGPLPDEAIGLELRFDLQPGSRLSVRFPIIAGLARGHRQHVTVRDAAGQAIGQYLLDSKAPALTLDVQPGRSGADALQQYLLQGVWHIWLGFDHILFLVTLLLPAVLVYEQRQWKSVGALGQAATEILKTVTAFTLAHSITLALAALELIRLPAGLIEPAIAASVLVTALNNLYPMFPRSRWKLAFVFGLVHGCGFAGVLLELGLPAGAAGIALLGFNLGVEAGQMAIVALLLPLAYALRHTRLYRVGVLGGGSFAALLIAGLWTLERVVDARTLDL